MFRVCSVQKKHKLYWLYWVGYIFTAVCLQWDEGQFIYILQLWRPRTAESSSTSGVTSSSPFNNNSLLIPFGKCWTAASLSYSRLSVSCPRTTRHEASWGLKIDLMTLGLETTALSTKLSFLRSSGHHCLFVPFQSSLWRVWWFQWSEGRSHLFETNKLETNRLKSLSQLTKTTRRNISSN